MMRHLATLLVLLLAGCSGVSEDPVPAPGPAWRPDALDMGEFALLEHDNATARWQWAGEFPAYFPTPASAPPHLSTRIELPPIPLLLHATVSARSDLSDTVPTMGAPGVRLTLVDDNGTARCVETSLCALHVGERGPQQWTARLLCTGCDPPSNDFAVDLRITLADAWDPVAIGYHAGGEPALPLDARIALRPSTYRTSEPTVGATDSGTLFTPLDGCAAPTPAEGGDHCSNHGVLRSQDDGRTWQYLRLPSGPNDSDPWLWVDPDTSRIFRLALVIPCSSLAMSDDDGASWQFHEVAGCGMPGGHYQKLTTGPPPAGVQTRGYPNVVYYASSLLSDYLTGGTVVGHSAGVWVSPSLDGGQTWQLGSLVHPARRECYGWGGPVVVAPDGTAFSPAQYCDGVRIAISRDGGRTWIEDAMLTDAGMLEGFLGPSMAVDDDGRVYLVHSDRDGRVVLRWREPAGQWSAPLDVTPPGVRVGIFTLVEAGAPGRIALSFFGTGSDPGTWPRVNPFHAPDATDWHLHLVLSDDILAPEPRLTAFQATPSDDPIQRGCIDMQGSQVTTCRNLADFMDLITQKGRPLAVFPDGCIRCPDAASSNASMLGVAAVEGFAMRA